MTIYKYSDNDKARFASYVPKCDDPDACHLWTGGSSGVGYGQFRHSTGKLGVHRAAYESPFENAYG